jgi:hypothetical protein
MRELSRCLPDSEWFTGDDSRRSESGILIRQPHSNGTSIIRLAGTKLALAVSRSRFVVPLAYGILSGHA